MRIEPENRPTANQLNMFASRTWRPLYMMISWHGTGHKGQESNSIIERLSEHQLQSNSTRGSTPGWTDGGKWIENPSVRKRQGEIQHHRPRKQQQKKIWVKDKIPFQVSTRKIRINMKRIWQEFNKFVLLTNDQWNLLSKLTSSPTSITARRWINIISNLDHITHQKLV